ncbi:cob(I)alamin adenosyltransferase [Lewinella marina]|uniref:Corrinoid adenosyltransferase n=1 Tax=Neolewinella marina TaxID=438751 RepID=A0A2G0CCL7_9BACT|nr:cob(I)yrinic acid a,c-diamide adenosyltransferase [Neolewinella marina]NJB87590.1 cob(I)alamin adenosyltransferase [Neolewinella marina]PHK97719.1 ATP:cob(I)alamin adenosyltransferase [Neolewinella marina]
MKIYTRTGDRGETGLFSGRRVSKADPRVEAYGTIDELNACLGLLRDHLDPDGETGTRVRAQLLDQQRQLFALGAALADDRPDHAYRVPENAAGDLEAYMDEMDETLPAMTHFILPGGSPPVSFAHLSRTVCRRAERRVVEVEGADTAVIVYLNRLSDYLFVLARYLAHTAGVEEIKWES